MIRTLFTLVASGTLASNVEFHPRMEKIPLQTYTINLDLAPELRFREVADAHKPYLVELLQTLKMIFGGESSKRFLKSVKLPEEQRREIAGMANILGVPSEELLLAQYYYELTKLEPDNLPEEWKGIATRSCTSIVAQDSNGTIMHGRNLDYPPPFSLLQYDGTFTKGGQVVYQAATLAGQVGIGGGCMVPGNWSATINARNDCIECRPSESQSEADAAAGVATFPMLLRKVCENGGAFEDAVDYLTTTPMIATGYFIVAGAAPGEGAVITRNASAEDADVLRLAQGWPRKRGAPWFLAQTNFDHWDYPGLHHQFYGNDQRLESAVTLMEQVGQEAVDLEAVWGVLSDGGRSTGVWPGVFNAETIHTELMIPARGEMTSYLRHNIV